MFNVIRIRKFKAHAAVILAFAVTGYAGGACGQPADSYASHLLNRVAVPAPAAYNDRTGELFVARKGEVKVTKPGDAGQRRLPVYSSPHSTILRIRLDPRRDRLWIFDVEAVHVFDLAKKRVVRSVRLPNWSYIAYGFNCLPDLQLDAQGAALVSDNTQPKLWRIDARTLAVSEHEVGLGYQGALDAGFSALAMTEEGVVYAAMAAPGLLWRIDTASFQAERIPLSEPLRGACGMEALNAAPSRDLTLFVLNGLPASFEIRRVTISRSSGHVDPVAVDSISSPAALLTREGLPYFAATGAAAQESRARRDTGAFTLRPVALRK